MASSVDSLHFRKATFADYENIVDLYKQYYPAHHPLFDPDFWQWQFGDGGDAFCLIALIEDKVVGHLGVKPTGELAWLINVLVAPEYRGGSIVDGLFNLARAAGNLAVAVANKSGAGLLARKGWYRYADLCRYILVNPSCSAMPVSEVIKPVQMSDGGYNKPPGHFWQMPGLEGLSITGAGNIVMQREVGGIRVVDIADLDKLEQFAWGEGATWMDIVCSWNDPVVSLIEKKGWQIMPHFPWFLDPVDFERSIILNLFSERPLATSFLFHRTFADMLRIGRIKNGYS